MGAIVGTENQTLEMGESNVAANLRRSEYGFLVVDVRDCDGRRIFGLGSSEK